MTVEPLAPDQDAADAAPLHLPDLTIKGFCGIDELEIPRLGRVTLLAGKNGVGKTTVLDAVRVYASRARYPVIEEILSGRDEVSAALDEDGDSFPEPDWSAIFHGRDASQKMHISIGGRDQLTVDKIPLSDDQVSRLARSVPLPQLSLLAGDRSQALRVAFGGQAWVLPCFIHPAASGGAIPAGTGRWDVRRRWSHGGDEAPPGITCESLGPGLLANAVTAGFWDEVALTDDEDRAVEALRLVLGDDVDRVAVVGDDSRRGGWRGGQRRAVVKLAGYDRPVPLKSLGDGALRILGVALALANSRDGFLLMDEAENGIHHSVQRDFWRMVLRTAHENNVQVLATTHSWDCVRGFAQAAIEMEDVEGVLVRLDRDDYGLRAVEYSEEDLGVVIKQGIEVR